MKRLAAALLLVSLSAARLPAHDTDVTRTAREFLALLRPALQDRPALCRSRARSARAGATCPESGAASRSGS